MGRKPQVSLLVSVSVKKANAIRKSIWILDEGRAMSVKHRGKGGSGIKAGMPFPGRSMPFYCCFSPPIGEPQFGQNFGGFSRSFASQPH